MGSLKEFLDEHAEEIKLEAAESAKTRGEWIAAVGRLTAQIRQWIGEADPDHHLEIRVHTVRNRQEGVGAYDIDGLIIALGQREVRVEPIARYVVGPASPPGSAEIRRSYGRVDMIN